VMHAVQFHPLVSSEQLPQSMGIADIALVTLRPGFEGLVVPSKLLGYMARGVPTIYVGPYSDAEELLANSHGGICFRNGDAIGMARAIRELIAHPDRLSWMGAALASYYQSELSRAHGLGKYGDVFDSAAINQREHRRKTVGAGDA
jgi:colanic acid biosynthesis glycosyl transferase WcaI